MRRLTNEQFIDRLKKIYGKKYDYSKVEYKNAKTKVCIVCPEHGEFWQTPTHLLNNHACPKCSFKKRSDDRVLTIHEFIEKAIKVHGDRYDYSKVKYVNYNTKVCIICPEHGEFWQTPNSHLQGKKCKKCSHKSYKSTIHEFIEKAIKVHGKKYDYSKVEYVNNHTKVCIICPKHGEFWQEPKEHLRGYGCKSCKESHLESEVRAFLTKYNIKFNYDVRNLSWLKPLTLDFYLPDYNIAIECQGEQHFKPIKYFGGEYKFIETMKRDKEKYIKCINNGVTLIYYSSYCYNNTIYTDLNEIYEKWIKNNK